MLKIGGLQKSSMIDYPGKISCVIFTYGCNFRCGYCHNPGLICTNKFFDNGVELNNLFDFLKKRKNKLDAIVISGGEPTIQLGLMDFISEVKKLGFLIKLDTNGTNPDILNQLINKSLLDYVALDIKAPLTKYKKIVNVNVDINNIKRSIETLLNCNIDCEFRTTVIKSQLSVDDFIEISKLICGAKNYYLQKFVPSKIYDNNLINEKTYTNEEFQYIINLLKQNIENVNLR